MKLCSRCNENERSSSPWCRQCHREYDRERYRTSKTERERIARNRKRNADETKRSLRKYLEEHPCVDCGNSDIRVLEFDHRDRSTKAGTISVMAGRKISWDTLKQEIDKCEVRCANCHRIKTCEESGYWKSITGIGAVW